MEITGENGIGNILKVFLQFCFIIGIVILVSLPFILKIFGLNLNASMFFIYPNGILLLIIMYRFIELFDSLKNNNPFCEENIKILKSAGITTFINCLFWLIDFLYEIFFAKSNDVVLNLMLIFMVILFFGVSVALYILSELFRKAYEYKKENDLTI